MARRDGISNERVVRAAGAIQELPYAEQRLQKLIRKADNLEEKRNSCLMMSISSKVEDQSSEKRSLS